MENEKRSKRTLQELAFKDNFMFAAVMLDEEIAKGVLERTSVIKVKFDREMRRRYMLLEEIKREEYNAGKAEGLKGMSTAIINILESKSDLSDHLKKEITSIQSVDMLCKLTTIAAAVTSVEEFEKELNAMNF